MFRLAQMLYPIVGTTIGGVGVVVALLLEQDSVASIVAFAAIGAVIALPVTYFIAKAITENIK